MRVRVRERERWGGRMVRAQWRQSIVDGFGLSVSWIEGVEIWWAVDEKIGGKRKFIWRSLFGTSLVFGVC